MEKGLLAQYVPYDNCVRLALCLNSILNVKALVGAFNQEKALVGAFSMIVKSSRTFVKPSFQALPLNITPARTPPSVYIENSNSAPTFL